MKFFICILVLALAIGVKSGPNEEMKQQMDGIAKQCGEEYGVTHDMFENMMKGNMIGLDDQKKCAAKCFLEKIGVIDGSGKIIDAKIQDFIKMDPSKEGEVLKCAKIDHNDPCEKALQIVGCVMKLCHGK